MALKFLLTFMILGIFCSYIGNCAKNEYHIRTAEIFNLLAGFLFIAVVISSIFWVWGAL